MHISSWFNIVVEAVRETFAVRHSIVVYLSALHYTLASQTSLFSLHFVSRWNEYSHLENITWDLRLWDNKLYDRPKHNTSKTDNILFMLSETEIIILFVYGAVVVGTSTPHQLSIKIDICENQYSVNSANGILVFVRIQNDWQTQYMHNLRVYCSTLPQVCVSVWRPLRSNAQLETKVWDQWLCCLSHPLWNAQYTQAQHLATVASRSCC